MFFDKKAKQVEQLMRIQYEQIAKIISGLNVLMKDYLQHDKHFKKDSYVIHKIEHTADKTRRKIGLSIYHGAFLPIYREDYFTIVEMADKIANKVESIGDFLTLTRPQLPDFTIPDILEIVKKTEDIFKMLTVVMEKFLTGNKKNQDEIESIRRIESEIDSIQFRVTRNVFKSDMDRAEKFHTKALIDGLCKISNLIEDLGDQYEILAAKHQF